jgi:hypothetical protein
MRSALALRLKLHASLRRGSTTRHGRSLGGLRMLQLERLLDSLV